MAQMELKAKVMNQSTQDQLLLAKQLKATGEAVSRLTLWKMKLEEGGDSESSRSEIDDTNPFSSIDPEPSTHRQASSPNQVHREHSHHSRPFLPKMSFPQFDGVDPKIWKDKCQEYFKLYNISDSMKTSAASLHMEGNAARWYQVYKLHHGLVDWEFGTHS